MKRNEQMRQGAAETPAQGLVGRCMPEAGGHTVTAALRATAALAQVPLGVCTAHPSHSCAEAHQQCGS